MTSAIPDATVDFVVAMLKSCDGVTTLEKSLTRNTGRPRSISPTAILAALLLLAMDDRPLYLTRVVELLYFRISSASRVMLDVKGGTYQRTLDNFQSSLMAYR